MPFCSSCAANPFKVLFPQSDSSLSSFESHPRIEEKRLVVPETQIEEWVRYVHVRNSKSPDEVIAIIKAIYDGISNSGDPILGDEDNCVRWHGELKAGVPVVHVDGKDVSVINILFGLFADDECFSEVGDQELMTECGDPQCVNIRHVVGP